MSLWSETRVKHYLSDFASRKNVALQVNSWKAWRGTGADLIGETVASLCLLFVGNEPRAALELFYEIHPSQVIFLCSLLFLTFCVLDMRKTTGLC
jgi:hypothetical protein